jgi:hypothetical protein
MIFVSSWDDGHPLDERVAGVLHKYGLKGTFYVPIRNREGLPVLSAAALRRLGEQFEIGSHTLDHTYLTELSNNEVERQLADGKAGLEDLLGARVDTFCYPGGQVNANIRRAVREAGFGSARTVENLRLEAGTDPFMIPTTLQFYPHRRSAIVRNFAKRGHYMLRVPALKALCSKSDWIQATSGLLRMCAAGGGVFHLWGHSWEIEKCGLWREFEEFLLAVSAYSPKTLTVSGLAANRQLRLTGA